MFLNFCATVISSGSCQKVIFDISGGIYFISVEPFLLCNYLKNALEKLAADFKLVKQVQMSAKSDFDQSKTDLELETLLHGQKIVAVKEEVNVLKHQLASEQEKNTVGLWF